ncbi:MAG: Fe-S cluster assembly protein SufB, partial [Spirochaetales bacterium]
MKEGLSLGIGEYKYGFAFPDRSVFKTRKGLNEEVVKTISHIKAEPDWMLQYRLRGLQAFLRKPMPTWGA